MMQHSRLQLTTLGATMRILAILLLAAALGGCAASSSSPNTTQPPDPTDMRITPSPSLQPGSAQPSRAPAESGGDELTGRLGADSIEGGCGYLQSADGTRYEVLYPDGWTLTLSPLALTSPDGEVVARGGDEVTVRGNQATDMASICQIGPIFRASEVVTP
jgi:hypothetical protein